MLYRSISGESLSLPLRLENMTESNLMTAGIHEVPQRHGSSGFLYLVLVTSVAALGGLLFGYDTAVISGAIGLLQKHFSLSASGAGWAASCALIGCVLGTGVAGLTGDWLGRRKILQASACFFLVSAIGAAVAPTIACFIAFRIVGGIGIGAASIASPLYISEIAPKQWRGRLVTLNQLAIVVGMLVIYAVNYWIRLAGTSVWNETIGWRWMFASGIAPSLLLMGLLFLVPETARFLMLQGRTDEAEAVAFRLGDRALTEMLESPVTTLETNERLGRVLWLGISLAVLQQITGINVFLYYAPEIFRHLSHSDSAPLLETVAVGATNVLFTILAMGLVDRVGRKPLLISGSLGMGACLVAMGGAAIHSDTGAWLVAFVLGYIACFALSVGPVTWVFLSEIFPAHFRARAMAIATSALWLANFAVSQTFPMMDQDSALLRHFGHAFPFFLYSGFCALGAWFVWQKLPETKGRSLEEISSWWTT
jgi:MFS transporter, SP family, xylose:H+ symportor